MVKSSWCRLSNLFEYFILIIITIIYFSSSLSLITVSISVSVEYPCRLCNLKVKNHDDSIQCDLCDKWDNIYYMNVREKVKNDSSQWYHSFYTSEMLFQKMSKWSSKPSCSKTCLVLLHEEKSEVVVGSNPLQSLMFCLWKFNYLNTRSLTQFNFVEKFRNFMVATKLNLLKETYLYKMLQWRIKMYWHVSSYQKQVT